MKIRGKKRGKVRNKKTYYEAKKESIEEKGEVKKRRRVRGMEENERE